MVDLTLDSTRLRWWTSSANLETISVIIVLSRFSWWDWFDSRTKNSARPFLVFSNRWMKLHIPWLLRNTGTEFSRRRTNQSKFLSDVVEHVGIFSKKKSFDNGIFHNHFSSMFNERASSSALVKNRTLSFDWTRWRNKVIIVIIEGIQRKSLAGYRCSPWLTVGVGWYLKCPFFH